MHKFIYPVLLPADPAQPLEAATKQYVDNHVGTGGGTTPPPADLDDLTDVTISSPTSTQILTYNGSQWINAAAPTVSGGAGGGTGMSSGSYTVAASNATAAQKTAANAVCDGIDDQVQIQAAINATISGGSNFSILLTQGTFNITDTIYLKNGTKISGMSRDGTILKVTTPFAGNSVFRLNDNNVHATELGNFRIDGNNGAGTKINGIWFNNNGGDFTAAPTTDPDPVHYIHDIYILNISGNGIVFSTQQSPTITANNDSTGNCRESVIYNTIVRNPGEHGYWLNTPDSKYIGLAASSAGNNYADATALTNPRPNLVIKGGNARITTSKVYSGNSHGFWMDADRIQVTNCEAQDTGDNGWHILTTHSTFTNIQTDTCGRITGTDGSHGATNANVCGIHVGGYNNMINGRVILRHRGWANEGYYQKYGIFFDSSSGFNIVEIHSQLDQAGGTYNATWFGGSVRGRYVRLTNDNNSTPPRFFIDNVEKVFG